MNTSSKKGTNLPLENRNDRAILEDLAKRLNRPVDRLGARFDAEGKVVELDLNGNNLTSLPGEIVQLKSLTELDLGGNNLTSLPGEIVQLDSLTRLDLSGNGLTSLPGEIAQLKSLTVLYLSGNGLTSLPGEIAQLENLTELNLGGNNLTSLPGEIAQLKSLTVLDLRSNGLTSLPGEIAQLKSLTALYLDGNPVIKSLPPEIVEQGIKAILSYFHELSQGESQRYEAKLVLVGEGGTGKSSLLTALRGEEFLADRTTTHGIEVGCLKLFYPGDVATEMTMNTWDFGGQEIYHATHQFFLTHRSLYLVLWNARLGAEQGRLTYWLETIKAHAPDVPILLVATHVDERAPDVDYVALQRNYPQLVGNLGVSNKEGLGIEELREVLRTVAAGLPVMGMPWPRTWSTAEDRLVGLPDHHIGADAYAGQCVDSGVSVEMAKGELGQYLHDLGKILYFREDDLLSNLVILKPNWITKAISRVLTDDGVRDARGILEHADLPRIWERDDEGHTYERHLYPVFLRLMEKFDLSYQIDPEREGSVVTHSLIPQLLPFQQPDDLPDFPQNPPAGQNRVDMVYRLNFVPAGILSWFIVRTHRYTTGKQGKHWRSGVVLEYQGHQAHVELNSERREISLTVQGSFPQTFFTLLKETMDLILDRFKGLKIQRDVPCICHRQRNSDRPCDRFFAYNDLIKFALNEKAVISCYDSFVDVSVLEMLYGIHVSTDKQIMLEIREGVEKLTAKNQEVIEALRQQREILRQQSELIASNLTRRWNGELAKNQEDFPSLFVLMPKFPGTFNWKDLIATHYRMHLLCQYSAAPHMVDQYYDVHKADEWWKVVSPWLNQVITFLRYAVPVGAAINGIYAAEDGKKFEESIKLVEKITESLSELHELEDRFAESDREAFAGEILETPALRALRKFLQEADKECTWGGLSKVKTPDGNILWLCEEHSKLYAPRKLVLPS